MYKYYYTIYCLKSTPCSHVHYTCCYTSLYTIVAAISVIDWKFLWVLSIFKGAGGLHQNSFEIDFIVVSDRGE